MKGLRKYRLSQIKYIEVYLIYAFINGTVSDWNVFGIKNFLRILAIFDIPKTTLFKEIQKSEIKSLKTCIVSFLNS